MLRCYRIAMSLLLMLATAWSAANATTCQGHERIERASVIADQVLVIDGLAINK